MTAETLALPLRLSQRVEKLARMAGQTPEEMLKLVIRDGLEYCEYAVKAVKAVNAGLADLDAGRSVSAADVRAHFAKRRSHGREAA